MEDASGKVIYRAMLEENGMPKLGMSASTLGIRLNMDIVRDFAGMVHRPAFHPRGKNGLSCSRNIQALPFFVLPVAWGGGHKKTVVWMIEEAELGVELIAGDDGAPGKNEHVSIGPASTMNYDTYVKAIEATQPKWKKVAKN